MEYMLLKDIYEFTKEMVEQGKGEIPAIIQLTVDDNGERYNLLSKCNGIFIGSLKNTKNNTSQSIFRITNEEELDLNLPTMIISQDENIEE